MNFFKRSGEFVRFDPAAGVRVVEDCAVPYVGSKPIARVTPAKDCQLRKLSFRS